MNLKDYTTAQLLAAFNARTGRDLKKFETRQIAEMRVSALIRDGGLDLDATLAELAQSAQTTGVDTTAELTDDQVPGFLRRDTPPEVGLQLPAHTEAGGALDTKIEEFFKISETDGRAAFIAAIEYGKSLVPAKAPRAKAERKPREPRSEGPTKREQAAALLIRSGGATAKEILALTGWPAVSVPALARSSKLTLRQEKDGKVTRYYAQAA